MGRLDPRLQLLLEDEADESAAFETLTVPSEAVPSNIAGPALLEPEVNILLWFKNSLEPAVTKGFQPTTVAGDVAVGRAPLGRLKGIAALESVVSIEMSRPLVEELNRSAIAARIHELHAFTPPRRGAGVIVGIIDSGIDFRHGCFRTRTGETRILALWDQMLDPKDGGSPPAGRAFGVEYLREDIDEALRLADPFVRVRHRDRRRHGTHVAGIAVGNGLPAGRAVNLEGTEIEAERPGGTYVGVAPEADIIIVAINPAGEAGESTAAINALTYLLEKAEQLGKPIVINMSQGDYVGPHDGTSLLERAIDNMLGKPGRILVKAAGNGRGVGLHAAAAVKQDETLALPFNVPASHRRDDTLDIWYARGDLFDVAVQPPGGAPTAVVAPDSGKHRMPLSNQNLVEIVSLTDDPANGDNNIHIHLQRHTAAAIEEGPWEILLTGRAVSDGRFHAWLDISPDPHTEFTAHLSDECTISTPGTARKVITVGSYITRFPIDLERLAPTSSAGPTRDGRPAPDLVAPGVGIISARRDPENGGQYLLLDGTSAAAPHVAGTVALLLERDPTLTPDRVRALLRRHARPDKFTDAEPSSAGAGKLDALASFKGLLLDRH